METTKPNDWQEAAQLNRFWRNQYACLILTDKLHNRAERLPHLAAQELREAEAEEALEGSPQYNGEDFAKEMTDFAVFFFGFCDIHNLEPDFEEAQLLANGQGTKSDFYDVLEEETINMGQGDIQKNATRVLSKVISKFNHQPNAYGIRDIMAKVVEKNTANRPPEYYLGADEAGRPLTEDEALRKYEHTEYILKKILRIHYGSPLQTWQHQPHADLILDFHQPDINRQLVKQRLTEVDQLVAEQLYVQLTADQPTAMPQKELLKKLEVAGGVLLHSPAEHVIYQAR